MGKQLTNLGWPIVVVAFAVIAFLWVIAYWAYKRRLGTTTRDYFLASSTLGYIVIGLSLFAVQYSGNSFVGYVAKIYRTGFFFLIYPTFMIAIVAGMLIFAPPIWNVTSKKGYTSFGQMIVDRYGSKLIAVIASACLLWGAFVQFFEQNFAMGYLGSVVSGGVINYQTMVILFALTILVTTWIGGFRGVVWITAIQGALMLIGLIFVIVLIGHYGGVSHAVSIIAKVSPKKLLQPSGQHLSFWFSAVFLVMLGASIYPQNIQHYMGIKGPKDLRRMLFLMPPLYFFTAMVLFFFGIVAAGTFPGLSTMASEKVVPMMLEQALGSHFGYTAVSFISVAVTMATLSTASGTAIVIAMFIVKDFYNVFNPKAKEEKSLKVSKWIILIVVAIGLFITLYPHLTIWRWLEIKFEILMQAIPAVFFALYSRKVHKGPVLIGMIVGLIVALGLTLSGHPKVYGIHAGMIGFIINALIAYLGSYITKPSEKELKEANEIVDAAHSSG